MNGALALIAARKIEINIRPFAAFFGKESLKEQIHLHRIDCRNTERITNGAIRGRTAALNKDVVLQAELNDIPNNQEITLEPELLDQRKLAFDLPAGLFIVRSETIARAFFGALAKE